MTTWNTEAEAQKILDKEKAPYRVGGIIKGYGYQLEDPMQADFYAWAVNSYKELRGVLAHIPNQNGGGVAEGMRKKSLGVVAGYPDLMLPLEGGLVAWCELKTKTGSLNPAQLLLHPRLRALGHKVTLCNCFTTFRFWIETKGKYELKDFNI